MDPENHVNHPTPFIVGVGRSGTTLLRMMLDSHPDLAIPPETHFLPELIKRRQTIDADDFLATLVNAPVWGDFKLSADQLRRAIEEISPFDLATCTRTFFRIYAQRFGKSRWGDKTPIYNLHMTGIHSLLPEARFIHIIRDGRDVALSLRHLWFGPGHRIEDQATDWARRIRKARAQARLLPRYLEVRFESLIEEPEVNLRQICEFIELPFDQTMLAYTARAGARLEELGDRQMPGGKTAHAADRRKVHARTTDSPDRSRVQRWKTEMSVSEREIFAATAGELLEELGYPV